VNGAGGTQAGPGIHLPSAWPSRKTMKMVPDTFNPLREASSRVTAPFLRA
jgi:hypothetical protein